MASQPKNITKDIGGVSPSNFVQQGIQDNSLGDALRVVGGTALAVDREIQYKRLDKELENLRTEYLTSADPVKAVQEGIFSDSDREELGEFARKMTRDKLAMQQGRRITFDSYRIRGETLLRTAIARRPGLAEEFRRIASNTLGTDVVGASVLFLAEQEGKMDKEMKDTRDAERARQDLASVGVMVANLPDDQMWSVYNNEQVQGKLQQLYQLTTTVQQGELLVKQQDQGVSLTRQQNIVAANASLAEMNIPLFNLAGQIEAQISSGQQYDPTEIATSLTMFRNRLRETSNMIRAAYTGKLPDADIDKLLANQDKLYEDLEAYASGEVTLGAQDSSFKYILNSTRAALAGDPEALTIMGIKENLGEQVAVRLMDESSTVRDGMILAYTNLLSESQMAQPEAVGAHAGQIVREISQSVFNPRGAAPKNEREAAILAERQAKGATTLARLPLAFMETADKDYKFKSYSDYLDRLRVNGDVVAKAMTEEQRAEVVEFLPQATAHYLYNIERAINSNPAYASLRGKVKVGLTESGEIITPVGGASLSAQEKAWLAQFNTQMPVGTNYLRVMSSFAGADAKTATERLRAARAAPPSPTPSGGPPQASGGSQRPTMEVTLGTGATVEVDQQGYEQYSPVATKLAERYDIPSNVLFNLIAQESRWNPEARSGTGVRGLAQVTRDTAAAMGITGDSYADPENQLEAGAKYLSQMNKQFKGDWVLAVAAYNAGPGALKKWLQTGKRSGNLSEGGEYAGDGISQTETYVQKVLGFEGSLLDYGREVLGIPDPEEARAELAATAAKEGRG